MPVASPMSQLQVTLVTRVSAFGDWNDMINARRQRMRITQVLINWFAADAADSLRRIDCLLVALECKAVRSILVWPVTLVRHVSLVCHAVTPPPGGIKKRPGISLTSGIIFQITVYHRAE